jgi:hypothetical protein
MGCSKPEAFRLACEGQFSEWGAVQSAGRTIQPRHSIASRINFIVDRERRRIVLQENDVPPQIICSSISDFCEFDISEDKIRVLKKYLFSRDSHRLVVDRATGKGGYHADFGDLGTIWHFRCSEKQFDEG